MSSRNLLIIAAAVVVSLLLVVGAVLITLNPGREPETSRDVPQRFRDQSTQDDDGDVAQEVEKVVYFQSPRRAGLLVPARRSVFNTISLGQQAGQLVQKLIEGPGPAEGLLPTIPAGTRLRRCYLAEDGTAYVVLSQALRERHEGGTAGELITIYSIVNTLCMNFPSIQRVRIMIEGAEENSLAGHIDLSEPLLLNTEFFAPSGPPPASAVGDEGGGEAQGPDL